MFVCAFGIGWLHPRDGTCRNNELLFGRAAWDVVENLPLRSGQSGPEPRWGPKMDMYLPFSKSWVSTIADTFCRQSKDTAMNLANRKILPLFLCVCVWFVR